MEGHLNGVAHRGQLASVSIFHYGIAIAINADSFINFRVISAG